MPYVLVTDFEIGRSLGGRRTTFRGGRAGFEIADEKPIASGTVGPPRKKKSRRHELETGSLFRWGEA